MEFKRRKAVAAGTVLASAMALSMISPGAHAQTCASLAALGGGVGATNCVNSTDIANNTITSADVANESLRDFDILDEAGMDFNSRPEAVHLTNIDQVILSKTITAPTSGFVLVNASGYFFGSFGSANLARCSIGTGSFLDFDHMAVAETTSGPNGVNWVPFALTRGFAVPAGSTTFALICEEVSGTQMQVLKSSLTALFVPTVY